MKRRPPSRITAEQRAEMRRRYEAGDNTVQIAADFGCRPNSVSRSIRLAGGTLRTAAHYTKGRSRAFNAKQCAAIVARYKAGESAVAIAKPYGVSAGCVLGLLRRAGVEIRSPQAATALVRSDITPPDKDREARRLYESGLSTRKVAAALKMAPSTVRSAVIRAGGAIRAHSVAAKGCHEPIISDEQAREFVRRHNNGEHCNSLAREFGCAPETVGGAIRRIGGTVRSRAEAAVFTRRDVTGKTFGRLTGVRRVGKVAWGQGSLWEWTCSCGQVTQIGLNSVTRGNTQSCGCIAQGETSLGAYLAGNFYEPERDAEFYVYSLANFAGYLKPGIDSNGLRAVASYGQYGEQLLSIELPRIEAWLLEQAVLTETRLLAAYPSELEGWAGYTELRRMDSDALIGIAANLHDQLLDLGRHEFALRFVPMTSEQAQQITMWLETAA